MKPAVGGQAVMEGVMMRARNTLAIAVRLPDGQIKVETRPWYSLTSHPLLKKPFVRGFPIMVETLINGIKALNFSAQQALAEEEEDLKPWALALTMAVALALAFGLFVVLPHVFSLGMQFIRLGGGVDDLSFHAWDGLFKMILFIGYIAAISLMPDIKRVFQYHGAEHKVIAAYEDDRELIPYCAKDYSRLHPRCGTAFLLIVICLSIVLNAVLVPLLLKLYAPQIGFIKQTYIIVVKFLLMVPISAIAYEMIKLASKHQGKTWCNVITFPGMALQLLTTKEPDETQIEVAIAALKGALACETSFRPDGD